jgi:F0F1-type ATP synthase assembly protein I
MPENRKQDAERPSAPSQKAKSFSNQLALAMELPFVFVGAIGVGALMGYLLDRWLHTDHIFVLLLGGLGFVAGLREILRRLPSNGDGPKSN